MDSVYVELAIALVLAFFLLSLLVSGINEGINRLFGIRSKFLWSYLRDLLDGPEAGSQARMPARMIDVLWKVPRNAMPGKDPRPLFDPLPPPATMFAAGEKPLADRMYERLRATDQGRGERTGLSNIPPNRFAVALMEIVAGEHGGNVDALLTKLQKSKSPLHLPLRGLWGSASGNMEKLTENVAGWFDAEMDGLSVLYRRQLRWVLTVLATAVTLVVSVDALEFSKSVLRDDALRSEVVAVASGNPGALEELQAGCVASAADGEVAAGAGREAPDPYGCVTNVLSSPALVAILANSPVSLSVPGDGNPSWSWNGREWGGRLADPGHWLGFALTILALLFGAPFWWDVLRRLAGLKSGNGRSSG